MIRPFVARWSWSLANGFREILELRPHCAHQVIACLIPGGGALLGVGLAALRPVMTAMAIATVIAAVALAVHAVLHGPRVTHARLAPDDCWMLDLQGVREPVPARLVRAWGESRGPLIGLQWQCASGRWHAAWLPAHNLPGQVRRRLRVRLRLA